MDKQTTIEDMNTFIESLRYAETLVNTANAGVDLSFDFITSYDYYGTVKMGVDSGTTIEAPEINISSTAANNFFNYNKDAMKVLFYEKNGVSSNSIKIMPISNVSDEALMTYDILNEESVSVNGIIDAPTITYSGSLSFDYTADDDNTVMPISVYDQIFAKSSDIVSIGDESWSVKIAAGPSEVRKEKDSTVIDIFNGNIVTGINSRNIVFESNLETMEELLAGVINETGEISDSAVIPADSHDMTNIFTMKKFDSLSMKKFGDEIELHLEDTYTDTELKEKIDTFFESSSGSPVYSGEDCFITLEQANMLAEHIYRKITGIKRANIQL
jgi:hypothetical protein